ncbi:hypothetical protein, partial [Amycolatopsis sp. NPDC000740]|uniref:hypothetical protein n=1 Tax=Amycolatopsis sp. NPDC000740 TaxID=3154269 RepID=UPI00332EE2E0
MTAAPALAEPSTHEVVLAHRSRMRRKRLTVTALAVLALVVAVADVVVGGESLAGEGRDAMTSVVEARTGVPS